MSVEATNTAVAAPAAESPSETPRRAATSLKDELKTFISEKRKSSVPEEVEDYRKLSVCAISTGVAIAIIRQRMLGPFFQSNLNYIISHVLISCK